MLIMYLGIFALILIVTSYFISRKSTSEDFLIGGRNRSFFSILSSKFAGAIGISTFITFTGFAYQFGSGIFWLEAGLLVGYVVFALWAAPITKKWSMQGHFYTMGDLPQHATGDPFTKKITNGLTVLVDFFWVILALVGGAKVIAHFELMSYAYALGFTSLIILAYVLISGFSAVIFTDILQAIIILVLLAFVVFQLVKVDEIKPLIANGNHAVPVGNIVGFIIYGCLSVFGMADRYQLCYAGKSIKAVKRGMGFSIVPIILMSFLLFLVGLKAYFLNPELDPAEALTYVISSEITTTLLPLFLVMLFAGLMSSADTSIFAIASHLVNKEGAESKVKQLRLYTLLVVFAATTISFFWTNIVDITILGAGMRIILGVPSIYILLEKKHPQRYLRSALGGVIGCIVGVIVFGITPIIPITILLGGVIGLFVYKK